MYVVSWIDLCRMMTWSRSFIQDILDNPNDAVIVDTILSMAEHLQLQGVERGLYTDILPLFKSITTVALAECRAGHTTMPTVVKCEHGRGIEHFN